MSQYVIVQQAGSVLELRLHRPDKRNALSLDMYRALSVALRRADASADIHAVLLQGDAGAFCAGNEIEAFINEDAAALVASTADVFDFMDALRHCSKPVVVAVDGMAVGIGATLLLHCDLVYATPRSRLVFPFARLGLCAEFASSLLLPRIAGRAFAAEALLLGEPVTAEKAHQWGLINEVLPEGALLDHARNRAQALAALPPDAVQATRRLVAQSAYAGVTDTIARERAEFTALLVRPDVQAGFRQFVESKARRA